MKNIILKKITLIFISLLLISSFPHIISQNILENKIQSNSSNNMKAWTSLYYIDADTANPLWNIIANLDVLENKLIGHIASADNLNVLVLQDKIRDPAVLYYIDGNHNAIILEELGEVNMGDSQTLVDFIDYGKNNYPAERYQLCVWGHANAWYGVCKDDTNKRDPLTPDEFQQALMKAGKVDLLCFMGCCKMGSLEVVYELRNYCDVYIASEDDGYGPHWYNMLDEMCELFNINPQLSTIECGENIVRFIANNPNEFESELTISAISADKIDKLVDEVEKLSIILYENDDFLYENLKSARNSTREFDFIKESFLLDIYDFMDNYIKIEANRDICQILLNIKSHLSEAIIAESHGFNQNGSHGLSIFYSTNDMISVYADFNLDFTDDTHWDELLNNHKENIKNSLIKDIFLQKYC